MRLFFYRHTPWKRLTSYRHPHHALRIDLVTEFSHHPSNLPFFFFSSSHDVVRSCRVSIGRWSLGRLLHTPINQSAPIAGTCVVVPKEWLGIVAAYWTPARDRLKLIYHWTEYRLTLLGTASIPMGIQVSSRWLVPDPLTFQKSSERHVRNSHISTLERGPTTFYLPHNGNDHWTLWLRHARGGHGRTHGPWARTA